MNGKSKTIGWMRLRIMCRPYVLDLDELDVYAHSITIIADRIIDMMDGSGSYDIGLARMDVYRTTII